VTACKESAEKDDTRLSKADAYFAFYLPAWKNGSYNEYKEPFYAI
jgi:hypothetical protein